MIEGVNGMPHFTSTIKRLVTEPELPLVLTRDVFMVEIVIVSKPFMLF